VSGGLSEGRDAGRSDDSSTPRVVENIRARLGLRRYFEVWNVWKGRQWSEYEYHAHMQ